MFRSFPLVNAKDTGYNLVFHSSRITPDQTRSDVLRNKSNEALENRVQLLGLFELAKVFYGNLAKLINQDLQNFLEISRVPFLGVEDKEFDQKNREIEATIKSLPIVQFANGKKGYLADLLFLEDLSED